MDSGCSCSEVVNDENRIGRPAMKWAIGKIKASLVCGTCGKWLWLLRSRPDQIGHATMRRGPPGSILPANPRAFSENLRVGLFSRDAHAARRRKH